MGKYRPLTVSNGYKLHASIQLSSVILRSKKMRSRGVPSGVSLSRENDDSLEALSSKVSALRALSYDIEGEVQAQMCLLDDMVSRHPPVGD